jgi:two-component SAPR family response regulator
MKNSERRFLTSQVCEKIKTEIEQAEEIHGSFHSLHEALAVIREEYMELEEAIFWGVQKEKNTAAVYSEAIQLAAMATKLAVMISSVPNNPSSLTDAERSIG